MVGPGPQRSDHIPIGQGRAIIGLRHFGEGLPIASAHSPSVEYHLGDRVPLGDSGFTVRYEKSTTVSPDDVSAAIEVLRRAFNGGPSWFNLGVDPADHLRWKTTTAAGDASIELVEDGDRVIGMKLSFRQRFLFRGSAVTAEVGNDSAIDPSHQGRGISKRLAAVRPDIIPLEPASLVIDQKTHPFFKGARAQPFGNRIDALMKPLSLRRTLTARSAGEQRDGPSHTRSTILAGRRAARLRSIWDRMLFAGRLGVSTLRRSRGARDRGAWTIRSIDRFGESAEAFWLEAAKPFDLIQVRDQAWLNWRYCDPRGGPFAVRVAEEDGALLGYAALRITEREVVLADLLTLPGREDVAASLIADVVEQARQADAPRVRCWMARHHPYRQALGRAGFVRYDLPAPLIFETGTLGLEELDALRQPSTSVHFMTADTDHV